LAIEPIETDDAIETLEICCWAIILIAKTEQAIIMRDIAGEIMPSHWGKQLDGILDQLVHLRGYKWQPKKEKQHPVLN
jgi:hypothetical protein